MAENRNKKNLYQKTNAKVDDSGNQSHNMPFTIGIQT
jgi:hypothetical protein